MAYCSRSKWLQDQNRGSLQLKDQGYIPTAGIKGLVVNGATRNAQCATFPHFEFIAYTLQGLTETSALVCLRSAEYSATTGNRIPPHIERGRALIPTYWCVGVRALPPIPPSGPHPIAYWHFTVDVLVLGNLTLSVREGKRDTVQSKSHWGGA